MTDDLSIDWNATAYSGRPPGSINLDVSMNFNLMVSNVDLTAGLRVFNILDSQEVNSSNKAFEQRRSEGTLNSYYGAAYAWQAPRHIQLSLTARF